jgi:hypothetical protein
MLAPGEAVLNKEASDLVGRGVIAAANKAGLEVRRKGIVPQADCTGPVPVHVPAQGYVDGTESVHPDYSATTLLSGQATPEAIAGHEVKDKLASKGQNFYGNTAAPATPVQGYSEGVSDVPDPNSNNFVNQSTGVTTLGGGANGQSTANKYANIAQPMYGTPGVSTGPANNDLAKQNFGARAQMDQAISYGKAGGMDAASGIMKDIGKSKPKGLAPTFAPMPSLGTSARVDLGGFTDIQGFNDGTAKVGDLPDMQKVANQIKYPEANQPGTPNQTHGFTGDPHAPEPQPMRPGPAGAPEGAYTSKFTLNGQNMSGPGTDLVPAKSAGIVPSRPVKRPVPLAQPVTGPYRNVTFDHPVAAGKQLAPAGKGQMAPQGEAYVNYEESATMKPQQFRPGPGGAPVGDYEVNFANDGRVAGQKALPAPEAPPAAAAQGYSAEELAALDKVKAAGRARVDAIKNGTAQPSAGPAPAAAEAAPAAPAESSPAQSPKASKIPGIVGAAAALTAGYNKLKENVQKPDAFSLTKPLPSKEQLRANIRSSLDEQKANLEKPSEFSNVKASMQDMGYGPVPAALGAGAVRLADQVAPMVEGGKQMAQDVAGLFKTPDATPAPKGTVTKLVEPAVQQPAPEAQDQTPAGTTFAPARYTPEDINGQSRVNIDEKNYVQSADKAGMSRVAAGLQDREKRGINFLPPKQSDAATKAGTTDFWMNRGLPGGAAQDAQQKQLAQIQDIALNGGGRGDMTVSQYRNANARQKVAQGILADLTRAGTERDKMAVDKETNANVREQNALEKKASRDLKERELKQSATQHADTIAQKKESDENKLITAQFGDEKRTIRQGDYPAEQAKFEKAQLSQNIAARTKALDTTFTSQDSAYDQALAEALPEYAKAKAFLSDSRLTPEERASVQSRIDAIKTEHAGALNG